MLSRPSKFLNVAQHVRTTFFGMLTFMVVSTAPVFSQCLNNSDIQQMVSRLKTDPIPAINSKLRKELLEMRKSVAEHARDPNLQIDELRKLSSGSDDTWSRIVTFDKPAETKRDKNEIRLCEMFKTYGFLGQSLVGYDGVSAAFYIFSHFASVESQLAMLPVIETAINRNELPKNEDYGVFVDRLRLQTGRNQVFGTQAFLKDNLLILAPIDNEQQVDWRRASLGLGTLDLYLKNLELLYRTPVIRERTVVPRRGPSLVEVSSKPSDEKDEVVRVRSEVVSMNVRVLGNAPSIRPPDLTAADFKVFEDGQEVQPSFFAKAGTPFDLVLLLDLSGSTEDKQGLIRKATRRFIEGARPTDRISIVTFTKSVNVVVPLTLEREQLLKSIDKIKDAGASFVWDSLLYVLNRSFGERDPRRRRAIVMMSDGVDNNLSILPLGSVTSFAELVDAVRGDDTTIIPIYIETGDNADRMYRSARRSMSVLAEESGGQLYSAKKLENLDGVYEAVLTDLGTVYSVGYVPSTEAPVGTWHTLKVEIQNHPDLTARTRQGYFVKE